MLDGPIRHLAAWLPVRAVAIIPLDRPIRLLVLGIAAGVYLVCGPAIIPYDGDMMLRVSDSLVTGHQLRIEDPVLGVSGVQIYSPYGIGLSLLFAPLDIVGRLLFHSASAALGFYIPTITALTVLGVALVLRELGASARTCVAVALVYAFGTLAWQYSIRVFSEPVVALSIIYALLWLLRFDRTVDRRWLVAAGLLTGLAVLTRPDSILLVAAPLGGFGLALVVARRAVQKARLADGLAWLTPVALGIAIDLAYNWLRYGSVLGSGYKAAGFTTPIWEGLYGLLLSPGAGLLVFCPILIVALVGYGALFRVHPAAAAVVAGFFVLRLLFYSTWWTWNGGAVFGPRFLVPVLPLLVLPLAFVSLKGRARLAAGILLLLSLAVEVIGQVVPSETYNNLILGILQPILTQHMCATCGAAYDRAGATARQVMDFDWRYSPLLIHPFLLVKGQIAPTWAALGALAPVLLGIVGAALTTLFRAATRQDRTEAQLRGSAAAQAA